MRFSRKNLALLLILHNPVFFAFTNLGWVHYMIHAPERHVILFRRPKPKTVQDKLANNKVEENQVKVKNRKR